MSKSLEEPTQDEKSSTRSTKDEVIKVLTTAFAVKGKGAIPIYGRPQEELQGDFQNLCKILIADSAAGVVKVLKDCRKLTDKDENAFGILGEAVQYFQIERPYKNSCNSETEEFLFEAFDPTPKAIKLSDHETLVKILLCLAHLAFQLDEANPGLPFYTAEFLRFMLVVVSRPSIVQGKYKLLIDSLTMHSAAFKDKRKHRKRADGELDPSFQVRFDALQDIFVRLVGPKYKGIAVHVVARWKELRFLVNHHKEGKELATPIANWFKDNWSASDFSEFSASYELPLSNSVYSVTHNGEIPEGMTFEDNPTPDTSFQSVTTSTEASASSQKFHTARMSATSTYATAQFATTQYATTRSSNTANVPGLVPMSDTTDVPGLVPMSDATDLPGLVCVSDTTDVPGLVNKRELLQLIHRFCMEFEGLDGKAAEQLTLTTSFVREAEKLLSAAVTSDNDDSIPVKPSAVTTSSATKSDSNDKGFGTVANGLSLTERGVKYCICQQKWHKEFPEWKKEIAHVAAPETTEEKVLAGQQFDGSSFNVIRLLGAGNFGCVCLVEPKSMPGVYVALKIVSFNKEDLKKYAIRELVVGTRVRHENIARNVGFFAASGIHIKSKPFSFGILMEPCSHNLRDVIKNMDGMKPTDRAKKGCDISGQLLGVVKMLRANKVSHRDLKPDNIMYGLDNHVKVVDWGLARYVDEGGTLTDGCGTGPYIAPGGRAEDHDVYSLGIILHELLCGKRPFELKEHYANTLEERKNFRPDEAGRIQTEIGASIGIAEFDNATTGLKLVELIFNLIVPKGRWDVETAIEKLSVIQKEL